MIRRLLHRSTTGLHRDTGGQSLAFVALTSFLLCAFVILMLNNGRNLTHKVEAQNAVDAAAVSAATWQARGMNLIAMTNIMQSMLLAEAIFTEAVFWATTMSLATAISNASCYCDPYCDFDMGRCIQSIEETIDSAMVLIEVMSNDFMGDQVDFLFERMGELSDVAASIQEGFQAMAMTDAHDMGQANGLDYAFVYPNEMPLVEGEYTDLCDTMAYGNDGGYEMWWNTGWVAAMLAITITEYQSDAYGPAMAMYPHWATGPFGSPTQAAPYEMLFGEMAPLALGNYWWELYASYYYLVECQGWFMWPSLDSLTDTDQSVPLLLDEDFPDSGQYVGIGYDDPEDGAPILLPDHFENPYNEWFGMVTVAQAEVVNPYDDSMFVPRWHARLVPVTKLGDMPLIITDYLYTTDGLPAPSGSAAGRITLWTTTLSDLTQEVITH